MQNVFIKNKEHFKNTPEVQWIYKIDFIKEMNKYNKNVRYNNTMNKIKNTKQNFKQNIKNKFIEKNLVGEWDFVRQYWLTQLIYQTIKLPYMILKIIIKLIK